MDMQTFNQKIIEEFRANYGRVEMFKDYPMVILHTIGARTGNVHLVPLVLIVNDAKEMLIFGSAGGATEHPAWVHNLRSNPEIEIELGAETISARVIELPEAERRVKTDKQAAISDVFAGYIESASPRKIPVFRIEKI